MKSHFSKSRLIIHLGFVLLISCSTSRFSSDSEMDTYYNKELVNIENKFAMHLNKDIDSLTIEQFVFRNYVYPGMGIRNKFVYGNRKLWRLFKRNGHGDPERISVFLLKSYYQRKKTGKNVKFKEALIL